MADFCQSKVYDRYLTPKTMAACASLSWPWLQSVSYIRRRSLSLLLVTSPLFGIHSLKTILQPGQSFM